MAQKGNTVLVTNVAGDGPLLKVWGVVDKQGYAYIQNVISVLSNKFNKHQGVPGPQTPVLPNIVCCVKYRGSYVRAKICSVQQNGVVVHLIDSGAFDILPIDVFRLLYGNSDEEKLLLTKPPLATEFILANIVSITEKWESRCIETIQSFIEGKELEVSHYTFYNNRYVVKLVYGNSDIGTLLVNKRMAVMATIEDMFKSQMYSQQPPFKVPAVPHQQQITANEITTNGYSDTQQVYRPPHLAQRPMQPKIGIDNCRLNHQAYIHQPQQPVAQEFMAVQMKDDEEEEKPTTVLEFRGRILQVGVIYQAYVSFVEDGPNKFSVQIDDLKEPLKQLMKDIQKHDLAPISEPPLPGSVCLARLTNQCLGRAVVMGVLNDHIKIYFVDFGNSETVPYTDIYQMPPKFVKLKVLSIRFCLSGLKNMNITDEVKKYFDDIITGQHIELLVCEPEGPPLIQYGEVFFNSKNIKEYLKERFPDITKVTYGHLPAFNVGSKENVVVAFSASCSKFYVQLESNLADIEKMMNDVNEYAPHAPKLHQFNIGSTCIASYDADNLWYRVKILSVHEDKVDVFYVDYGNEETVPAKELRKIRKDLVTQMPSQALLCVLNGFQNSTPNKQLNTHFEELVLDKRLSMTVINTLPSGLLVDLTDLTTTKSIQMTIKKIVTETSSIHSESSISKRSNESYNSSGQYHQRDEMDMNKVSPTTGANPFSLSANDDNWRPKSKSWKDDHNEQRHDNRYQRREDDRSDGGNNNPFNRDGEKDRFNRNSGNDRINRNGGNDRFNREESDRFFNRDGLRNDRNNYRDGGKFINKFLQNENGRDDRSGGGRFAPSRKDHSSYDKYVTNDNDSTTSSKGSDKRGSRDVFQGRRDRDDRPNRFNKFGNKDNENNDFRPRGNEDRNWKDFKPNVSRDNGFVKPKEMINFDAPIDFSQSEKIEMVSLKIANGDKKKCELVYLTDPSNFYIHLIPENEKLDDLMERIASTYEIGGNILQSSQAKPGLACIAQYCEDEKWYRAVIKSVIGTSANVHFVDFGNVEKVSFDKLKGIEEEFTQLPIQAVHCKLFGPRKTHWNSEEIESFGEATNGKYLQAEFVTKDKDLYEVILCEIEEKVVKSKTINEPFCQGVDLMQAKIVAKSQGEVSNVNFQKNQLDLAANDSKWSEEKVVPGKKETVLVTWFDSPESFYCQSISKQEEFRPMMDEIQAVYVKRQSVNYALQPGYPVIAVFAEDGALYRAEVMEVNANRKHIVQYVDFGNKATVDQCNMYPVEKRFMKIPKQALRCSLKNVIPANGGSWSNINIQEIDKYFDADDLECIFHEEEGDSYLVSLMNNGVDIAGTLVEKKLALFSMAASVHTPSETATEDREGYINTPKLDIKLLPGQTLRAKVSSVESINKFYVQFSSAEKCDNEISSYMANKNPEMLALPSQLSGMQNQAIECTLHNAQPDSSSLNEKLKNLVENKEIIIQVENVENNRLIVQLYDLSGSKIHLTDDNSEIKICPICPMPILSSTHRVNVSSADHSNSLWLQVSSDIEKDEKLAREMAEFYSTERENIEPEPGQICATGNRDESWCRASIIRKTDTGVVVNLIDYGMFQEVPVSNLKVLDPKFYQPHQLAIHVSLNVTLSGTPAEQVKALKPHLQGKEFTATFYNVHKKWIVDLVENNVKLSNTLASLNLVKGTTTTKDEGIQGIVVGKKYKAVVTHADSPAQFWLQRSQEIPSVDDMQSELQKAASTYPAVDNVLEEGTLCAAVYSADGEWYRAEVIDADEDITTVRFIDYGNTDVINNKSGNIKELSDMMKMKKAYGIKCRLDVISMDTDDWSEATCERFYSLVTSVESLEVVLIAESVPKRVDLFIDGKSVSEILVEERHASKVHHEEELVNEIVDLELDPRSAFITHIYSPTEFVVQEEKSVSDLEKIADRLLVAEMLPKVADITEGLLCVAKYFDNIWYRARVIAHNEEETKVLFIDYGNSALVEEIRAIPEDVASIPPLSRKCSLQMPNYISRWPENTFENFSELAADGATIFLMDVLKEGETTIVKLTLDNEDVAEKLAPPRTVSISHINSLSDFWVHEENLVAVKIKLEEKLSEADKYPEVEVRKGLICAAQFPDDERWYRAKVLSQNENGTVVSFIDYGNTAVPTKIRELPEDLVNLAPICKQCCLQLPAYADKWPQDALDEFYTLAGDGIVAFFLDLVEEKESAIVNLFLGKENVAEKLVPQIPRKVSVSENKNDDAEKEISITCTVVENESISDKGDVVFKDLIPVYISQLNSPSDFWVQEEKDFDVLQEMEDSLLNADSFPQLDEIKEGIICAAKYLEDSLWYRAQVLSKDKNGTTVSFIDYGNSSVVTDIRTLIEDVASVPTLAKKCSLPNLQNVKEWPQETVNEFLELSANGTTCFSMDVLEDGETAIVQLYVAEKSVTDILAIVSQESCTEEKIVFEEESATNEEETDVSANESAIAERESAICEIEGAILEKQTLVPEEIGISQKESAVSEEKNVVLEKEMAIPEQESAIAAKETNVQEKEISVLEKENAVPINESTIPGIESEILKNEIVISEIECANSKIASAVLVKESIVPTKETIILKEILVLEEETGVQEKVILEPEEKYAIPGKECIIQKEEITITVMENIVPEIESAILAKETAILEEENIVLELENAVPIKESVIQEKECVVLEKDSVDTLENELVTETLNPETVPVTVYISYFNSVKEFWVHEEKSASVLAKINDRLRKIESQPLVEELKEGLICATRFPDDGIWYRSEVISYNENETTVRFIDYGNSSSVTEMRFLTNELLSLPPLAKKCSLKLPLDISEFPQESNIEFKKLSADGSTSFLMDVFEDGELAFVDLKIDGVCVADKLLSSVRQKLANEDSDIIEKEKILANGDLVNQEIKKAEIITIWHVISTTEFWGQVGNDPENVSGRLLHADEWPLVDEVKEGILCAAKVKEEWHRARVESVDKGVVEVLLIDRGITLTCTNFRQLPSDLTSVAPLSRKYSLKLPESADEWTQAAITAFCEYNNKSFSVQILEDGEIPIVKLLHRDEDISKILVSMHDDFSSKITGRLPPKGKENLNIYISHVDSPSKFWGQIELNMPELDAIRKRLKDAASLTPVKVFNVGRICAAFYSDDGQWYRAKILSHSEEGTVVFLIDYGSTCMTNQLRVLPHDLVNIDYLTTQYSLQKPAEIEEWTEEACKKFMDLVSKGATMFQYKILDLEKMEIQLIYQGMDFIDILAPLCKNTKDIELVDLTVDTPPRENPHEKIIFHESPDSAFYTGAEVVAEKVSDSSLTSPEVEEPVPSSSMENGEVKDVPFSLPEVKEKQAITMEHELTVDDIVSRMTCEPEENILLSSSHQTAELKSFNNENIIPVSTESKSKSEFVTKPYSILETTRPVIPKISYDDKLLPASISRAETPNIKLNSLPTLETPYSEQFVADAVSPHDKLVETGKDKSLHASEDKNIPE